MPVRIEEQVPLHKYTTLKVGGVARYFARVETVAELKEVLESKAARESAPPLLLGSGSNILVSDEGYPGLVIFNAIGGHTFQETAGSVLLTCGAGEILDEVIAHTVEEGWWGSRT